MYVAGVPDQPAARPSSADPQETTFVFDVEYAYARPPSAQHRRTHRIVIVHPTDDMLAARLRADQWIASHPGVVMPTGSTLIAAYI